MATKNVETPQDTGDVPDGAAQARELASRTKDAEQNPTGLAAKLHEKGKAEAAKHGG